MTDLEGHMLVCHLGENSTTYTQQILFQNIHPSTKCIKSSENIPCQDCSSEIPSSDLNLFGCGARTNVSWPPSGQQE